MKYTASLLLLLGAALAAGCAKSSGSVPHEDNKAYLEAWLPLHYPGATKTGKGIYIIEDIPGDGAAWDGKTAYTQIDYIVRSLSGTVTSSTTETMARQLGTYTIGNYYGPRYLATGEELSYAGVDEVLSGMRVGGTRTAIVPAWLLSYKRYDTEEEYLAESTSTSTAIYTITFYGQTADIDKDQYNRLKVYANNLWHETDTIASGIFFHSFEMPSTRTIAMDTTVYINYTGRLLNGQVFDTTIADTAKVHHIYSASKSYEPVPVTMAEEGSNIKLNGSSCITGFQRGLLEMHAYEKASFAFTSAFAYGATGSGSAIPAYAPLHFDIELVDKPE